MSTIQELRASRRMPKMVISFDKNAHSSQIIHHDPTFPVSTLNKYEMGSMVFYDLMKYADAKTNDTLYRYVGDDKVYSLADQDINIPLTINGNGQPYLFHFLAYSDTVILEIY